MNPEAMRGERLLILLAMVIAATACGASDAEQVGVAAAGAATPVAFDGADYETVEEQRAHGFRIAQLLGCNTCHLNDYSGADFGAVVPVLEGLWATNISQTVPRMDDTALERLLREGVHPEREMYLMPSKQSQFLGARDMAALIEYLRSIPPVGEETPPPPVDFEEAVTARLPDDYWRWSLPGQPRTYANAAEEVEYFAENAPPELGEDVAQGRLVALVNCTACHGAALDGVGEASGDVQAAIEYDRSELRRLLGEGVPPERRNRERFSGPWGQGHPTSPLFTEGEVDAVVEYTRRLVQARNEPGA